MCPAQYLLDINDELPESRRHKFTFNTSCDYVSCNRCNIEFDYELTYNSGTRLEDCITDDEALIKKLLE